MVQRRGVTTKQLAELKDSIGQEFSKLQGSIALVLDGMDQIQQKHQATQQFLDDKASASFEVNLRCLLNRWNELTGQRLAGKVFCWTSNILTGSCMWDRSLICNLLIVSRTLQQI